MKKINFYILALLTMVGFSACNEDFKDWADPQTNEQEPEVSISFQITAAGSTTFDLNNITDETIPLADKTLQKPDDTTVDFEAQIAANEDFNDYITADLLESSDGLNIPVESLQQAVEKLFGKRPVARKLLVRVNGYVKTTDGQASLARSNNIEIEVISKAPVIESAYYLIGGMNEWNAGDPSALIKLNHSGLDVYDDPIFSIVLEVSAQCYWKVVPQTTVTALEEGTITEVWQGAVLACETDGDIATEGTLSTEFSGAMQIEEAGYVRITLNMMESTYSVEFLGTVSPYMYIPGSYQGWAPDKAAQMYSENFTDYEGYVAMEAGTEFKVTSAPNWDGTNYGDGGGGKLSAAGDAGNLTVAETGYYLLRANPATLTWSATLTNWFIVGDATPGEWDENKATPMIYDEESGLWKVTATLAGGKELKFMANKSWDINLGGNMNGLSYGGGNIAIAEDGQYDIILNLSSPDAYKAIFIKK